MLCNGRRHYKAITATHNTPAATVTPFNGIPSDRILMAKGNSRFHKKGFKNSRLRVILSPVGVLEMMVCTAPRKPTIWRVHIPGALRMFCHATHVPSGTGRGTAVEEVFHSVHSVIFFHRSSSIDHFTIPFMLSIVFVFFAM